MIQFTLKNKNNLKNNTSGFVLVWLLCLFVCFNLTDALWNSIFKYFLMSEDYILSQNESSVILQQDFRKTKRKQ